MDTATEEPLLKPSTTLPPEEPPRDLLAALAHGEPVILVDEGGEHLKLPAEIAAVLRNAVTAMAWEKAVKVVPLEQCLDIRQAASFLHCEQSALRRLLDEGEIPCKEIDPSPHHDGRGTRRVLLADLLAFQEHQKTRTREAIDDLVRISEEHNLYEITADDPGPLR